MRLPGFHTDDSSFGSRRRLARSSGRKASRRRNGAHRLAAEPLEGRAVLAVIVPVPTITGVTDSNSAVLRTGGVTNLAPLTISGTVASDAATVTVFNGNSVLGTATISGRTWSFATAPLGEGIYNFRARATVGATTSPASPSPFVVTVDMTAPTAPTISNVFDDKAPFVGTVPRGGTTNDRTLTLYGFAEPGSVVEVFANDESLGMATRVGSTWRFTTKPLANDGSYSFTAKATDKAGNTSVATASPYTVAVDTVATTSITAIIDDVGNGAADVKAVGISNDRILEIQGTADAGSTVKVFDGRAPLGSIRADNAGTWKFTTRPLTNGQTYRFSAQATDAAGNTSVMSAAPPIMIDTTPPWRPSITGVDAGTPVADRGVTKTTSLTISGRSEPGSTVDVYDGSTLLPGSPIAVGSTGEWSLSVTGLAEGVHPFRATATDAAGNVSVLPSVTFSVTVDTIAPAAPTILSVVDSVLPNVEGVSPGDAINDPMPLLTGITEVGTVVKIYDGLPDPGTFLGTAAVTGTTWIFRPSLPLDDGIHAFIATATDVAGNESVSSTAYTIVVDTTPAGFAGFGTLPDDGTYEFGDEIFFEITFEDVVYVDGEPRIALDTVPPRYATYVDGSGTDTLVFKYVPELGDQCVDLDFASADALDLNGGAIRDAAGNDVVPTLPEPHSPGSFGDLTDIAVDARLTIDLNAVQPFGSVDSVIPGPSLTEPLGSITITFNAPLTRGLTVDSFDLFLEDRSMSTAGVLIENLGGNSYSLTLPPATHQSLKGRYRLDIGGLDSGIESNGVLMDTVVSLFWQLV